MMGLRGFVAELASRLIRINSENPPGREAEAASFVAERLAELGMKAWVDRFEGNRGNAVGVYETERSPSLLLVTHLDTVPAGDPELWTHPPFAGTIKGSRIYGRGAADAKGSLASMLGALKLAADSGWPVHGKLVFAAVADEEVGGKGVKRLLAKGVKAEYAVVGEPTSLQACVAHRGRLVLKVEFLGKAAHASRPQRGRNAIYPASKFILDIDRAFSRKRRGHRLLGPPTASVTMVNGGVKDNVIPESCRVTVDRRTLPGEEVDEVVEEVERLARKAAGRGFRLRVVRHVLPAETSPHSPITRAALKAVSEVLGKRVRPKGFPATCDMSYLVTHGGIPSVILGPGRLEEAHAVDESVEMEELEHAASIYFKIVGGILGGENLSSPHE